MSAPLFKHTVKSNGLLLLFITLLLLMYLTLFISMYDADGMEGFGAMLDMMPEGLINALGFNSDFIGLTGYLAGYFFGFLTIVFPMIFTIVTANRLIAKDVDRGSMAYLLVSPISRIRIVVTQALFMPIGVLAMYVLRPISRENWISVCFSNSFCAPC
jgi:ABC-2 type transport system permease protein